MPEILNTLTLHASAVELYGLDNSQSNITDNNHNHQTKLHVLIDPLTQEKYPFCHVISLIPFTASSEQNASLREDGYEAAVAGLLAIQHLNTGDGSIIKELRGLNDTCKIRFSAEFVDTQHNAGTAMNHVINIISRYDEVPVEEHKSEGNHDLPPCGFLGAFGSTVSATTSIATGLKDFVQVSAKSTSADLDDKTLFPKFARTIPSDAGTAEALVLYVSQQLHLQYIAVVNVNNNFGNAYVTSIRDAANRHVPDLVIVQIPVDRSGDPQLDRKHIRDAVMSLKGSKLLYSVLVLSDPEMHDVFMEEAYKQKIAGDGKHNFLFSDSFDGTLSYERQFPLDSPLAKAYQGSGQLTASGGLPGQSKYDKLQYQLRAIKMSQKDVQYLTTILPGDPITQFDSQEFLNPFHFDSAVFQYEATVLLGLSACGAVGDNLTLNGNYHYQKLLAMSFEGVSGNVTVDHITGSRTFSSTQFKVINFVRKIVIENSTASIVNFNPTLTDVFVDGQNWESIKPFVFSDNTINLPSSIPIPEVNENFLHPAIRAIVLILCAIAMLTALSCGIWTVRNRNLRVVQASQPFFLYLISAGGVIFASSIIPISFDPGNLSSTHGLQIACKLSIFIYLKWFDVAPHCYLSLVNFSFRQLCCVVGIHRIRSYLFVVILQDIPYT
jgi:hypothetical protein